MVPAIVPVYAAVLAFIYSCYPPGLYKRGGARRGLCLARLPRGWTDAVHRAIVATWRQYFNPPILARGRMPRFGVQGQRLQGGCRWSAVLLDASFKREICQFIEPLSRSVGRYLRRQR
jgi:hypothetical protein